MSVSKKITFDAGPTSPGDIFDFGGPHVDSLEITNTSGESIAYSVNSGSSYTTLAADGTVNLGGGFATIFRFRRVNSGGYPLAIDSTVGLSSNDGLFATNLRGAMTSGEWMTVPSIFRLRLTGTGTVTLDAQNSTGDITLGIATYTASNATDQIEFPYAGDNATMIRATLTGTTTAEVI